MIGRENDVKIIDVIDQDDESDLDSMIVRDHHYKLGYGVERHSHRNTQVLCVFSGVIVVDTDDRRFVTPAGHGLLIPPGVPHSHRILSDVTMASIYCSTLDKSLSDATVIELTDLARALLLEAVDAKPSVSERKASLVRELLIEEISSLPPKPLVLSFPAEPRLAAICQAFLEEPSPRIRIDDWADKLAMSRRTFTRFFRKETGVSLATWWQHAIVFWSLPRLAQGESITNVAFAAGYENVGAYITMFKRVMGMAPTKHVALARRFAEHHV